MLKHSLTRYTAPVPGVCKTAKSSEFFSFCGKFLLLMHRDLVPYTSGWFFLQQMKYHYQPIDLIDFINFPQRTIIR